MDLTAVASGGTAPYTYEWSPGGLITPSINVCPTENTTYSVVVTDANGCQVEDKVEVQSIDISCKNGKVIICHVANQKSLCVNVDAVPNHLGHGDSLGPCGLVPCIGNEPNVALQSHSDMSVTNVDDNEIFHLFPNPANSLINIEFAPLSEDILNLIIHDVNGKTVHTELYEGVAGLNKLTLGISDLPTGMYFITLQNGSTRYQEKFVKAAR